MVARAEFEAWARERAGYVTASRFGDVMAFGAKGQPLKVRQDYLAECVVERLTGEPHSMVMAQSLGWGNDVEPYGQTAYEVKTGLVIQPTGLIRHPTLELVACTPDGLVGDDGGFECKCPANSLVHLQTLINGMPEEHVPQIQGGMWITGRAWWDFGSFDPRMPEHLRLYVQRVPRDEAYIAKLEAGVKAFIAELNRWLKQLSVAA